MVSAHDSILPPEFCVPFDDEIGLQYVKITPDSCQAVIELQPRHWQPAGIVHGGVYCSIVESVASVSAFSWLLTQGGGQVVGVNNNTDFLRPRSTGKAYATSTPIHRGRRQQLWLVEIVNDDDQRLLARGQLRIQNIPLSGETAE